MIDSAGTMANPGLSMNRVMSAMMFSCRKASELTSEGMDHQLSPLKRIRHRLHMVFCKWCRRNERQLQMIRAAIGGSDDNDRSCEFDSTDRLPDEARASLTKKLTKPRKEN